MGNQSTLLDVETVQPDIPIEDQINRCRRNIMVHSVVYYVFNDNLISDSEYDFWGQRLIFLQAAYPEASENTPYMLEEFRTFSGTTSGFNLPLEDPWAQRTARWLLHIRNERSK